VHQVGYLTEINARCTVNKTLKIRKAVSILKYIFNLFKYIYVYLNIYIYIYENLIQGTAATTSIITCGFKKYYYEI
jgi:hypothetical protein